MGGFGVAVMALHATEGGVALIGALAIVSIILAVALFFRIKWMLSIGKE